MSTLHYFCHRREFNNLTILMHRLASSRVHFTLLLMCLVMGIVRSDVKAVLMEILDDILCQRSSVPGSNSHQDIVSIFLNAANFSKSNEGCAESSMSFEDFRRLCALFPSGRK